MRFFTHIILIVICTNSFSQTDFESNSTKSIFHPELINQIENFPKQFDFQLRFWNQSGCWKRKVNDLFVLTLKEERWISEIYKFDYFEDKKIQLTKITEEIEKSDSIWYQMTQNNILILPDMITLKEKFYYSDGKSDSLQLIMIGGSYYTFEFFKNDKYRRIEYHNPFSYATKYTHIPELRYVSNIVGIIFRKLGYEYEPD